ncbi:chemotaxis protein CheB [Deferribacterales bacterium Es71-Z0220]|jgi:two-component system CheB/CheR fusion protein|uniref:chemotaxis protein CheB n=1 Tax=Deferrivibrio essentukiensis TaxID=2880922 RepID=UPI001F6203A2|nr:chemotaxis protein CheB [Deferrivibrio essentukiensis]MBZ4671876.1 putative methyltransferase/methylesterase [Deferribacteraceae bacterium]MCB4203794.1 chemotaxis protein CheB [Deferrivibrio essentukiensis]
MKKTYREPEFYVGIGASAGGLEAIEQFIINLPEPAECKYAIIIIQHLSPDYKSMMTEILSKKTQLPVQKVEDGMVAEAGNIYLNTPRKNLKIENGKFMLTEPDYSTGINFPIDIFLRSLADDQDKNAVGIILSGTGSDGTRGIRAIKQNGGIVFVQDPKSAKFDGMPNAAINTGIVDFIMHPSEMPSQLEVILRHPSTKKDLDGIELSDTILNKIFDHIKNKHGVDFKRV